VALCNKKSLGLTYTTELSNLSLTSITGGDFDRFGDALEHSKEDYNQALLELEKLGIERE
jgi:hypothetical protein